MPTFPLCAVMACYGINFTFVSERLDFGTFSKSITVQFTFNMSPFHTAAMVKLCEYTCMNLHLSVREYTTYAPSTKLFS